MTVSHRLVRHRTMLKTLPGQLVKSNSLSIVVRLMVLVVACPWMVSEKMITPTGSQLGRRGGHSLEQHLVTRSASAPTLSCGASTRPWDGRHHPASHHHLRLNSWGLAMATVSLVLDRGLIFSPKSMALRWLIHHSLETSLGGDIQTLVADLVTSDLSPT